MNLASNHRRSWVRNRDAFARLGRPDNRGPELSSDLADLLLLPPRQRAVLYLHHVEGQSYDEVGALIGCSAATARKAAERDRVCSQPLESGTSLTYPARLLVGADDELGTQAAPNG